jgi:hypothetical protein
MTDRAADAFGREMQRIETLVTELEAQPHAPAVERARELVQAVLQIHAIGLQAIVQVAAGVAGREFIHELEADARIASLLALHGLGGAALLESSGRVQAKEPDLVPVERLLRLATEPRS